LYVPRKIRTASRPARIKMRIISAARASPSYVKEIPENTIHNTDCAKSSDINN